ncbi:MAG TPA: hypothetical protein PLE24_10615 [Chitinispirillaceae bacterium]|jgi:hypothetical protein|nr:hypothetical protein [Chitinispirillaceae bacterium]
MFTPTVTPGCREYYEKRCHQWNVAGPGCSQHVEKTESAKGVNAANRSRRIRTTLIIIALIGSVLILLAGILFTNKKGVAFNQNIRSGYDSTLSDNPLSRLRNDFRQNLISPDQFAIYLQDLLIRYDSLPEYYKTRRPVISVDQVYNELTQVWSLLNLHVRSSILEALPDFRTEINKKSKG